MSEQYNSSTAQQSVHPTLGILRTSQAISHALAFFWLDGFAVPAPAQVTQTVGLTGETMEAKELEELRKGIAALYSNSEDSFTEGTDILVKLYYGAKSKQANKARTRLSPSAGKLPAKKSNRKGSAPAVSG